MFHLIALGEGRIGLLLSATPKLCLWSSFSLLHRKRNLVSSLTQSVFLGGRGMQPELGFKNGLCGKVCWKILLWGYQLQENETTRKSHFNESFNFFSINNGNAMPLRICMYNREFQWHSYIICFVRKAKKKKKKILILLLLQTLPALMGRGERKQDHSRKMLNGQCRNWALCLLHQ